MSDSDGGPAFPVSDHDDGGVSVRDYFARALGADMSAYLDTPVHVAREAYTVAQAMVDEKRWRDGDGPKPLLPMEQADHALAAPHDDA